MTKLLIGLGILIVVGILFGALSLLWSKLFPEEDTPATPPEAPAEEVKELFRAVVHCTGGGAAFTEYKYRGIMDCLAASVLPGGGPLSCIYGCLGMGTCARVCPSGALRIREGVAVVEGDLCTACGKCVEACPRHIISLEPFRPKKHVFIPCASQLQGDAVRELCADGCVGCGLCAGSCPREAITLEEGLARIDYEKCDHCGQCVQKCPQHLIRMEKVAELPKPEPPKPPRRLKPKKVKPPKQPKPPKERKTGEREKPKLKLPGLMKPAQKETEEKKRSDLPLEEAFPVPDDVPAEETVEPVVPDDLSPVTPETSGKPGPIPEEEEEERPAASKTSAEAFEAFQQAVAAVGEVLGEQGPEEKKQEEKGPETPAEEENGSPRSAADETVDSGEKPE